MIIDVQFEQNSQTFEAEFTGVVHLTDGGYERGYEAGYAKGYAEGETAGYTQGEAHGRTEGYAQGKTDGHAEGYTEGYAKGYADGYNEGNAAGQESGYTKGHAEGYTEGETVGREAGYTEGHEDGYADGEKAEYDRFWDAYQQEGKRSNYETAFAGRGWYDSNFKPKYTRSDAQTTYGYMMFRQSQITDVRPLGDLKIDGCDYMFYGSKVKHIGRLHIVACSLNETFSYATSLTTIDLLHLDNINNINNPFTNCTSLKDVTFDGEIRKSISFAQSSKLSNASVQSIIDHLKDLTGAAAQTVTFHATVGGNLTAEQKAAITAKNWTLVY